MVHTARDLLEMGTADEDYQALTRFITEANGHLRPTGRILLNFGTSGGIDYLDRLIELAAFARHTMHYGGRQGTASPLTSSSS